jgi:hypothetical protein
MALRLRGSSELHGEIPLIQKMPDVKIVIHLIRGLEYRVFYAVGKS